MTKAELLNLQIPLSKIEKINDHIFHEITSRERVTATTLFLEGDLGAGKTTLTQKIGQTLGIKKPMTSPTYTIMNEYEANHPEFTRVIHMDLYRIETLWELQEYNLEEVLQDQKTLFIIEWSKTAKEFFAKTHCFQVDITGINEESRNYTLSKLHQEA